ncbi:nucleotidyltransferase family protein [Nocardioides marinquilinus]|uniref:Nucleotidyltransferase family protein n=1 Tax=Nocardioides marinquilinus TaxID=1210400 RepID=A0ABP9P9L1_9ACTN
MSPAGLLLAAGAGSRMGRPKALVHDPDGTAWLPRSVAALADGGCDPVTVVLGAAADQARVLVPGGVTVVVAEDWAEGMAASLRAGLRALADGPATPDAVVVGLVDLPDVGAEVVRRLVAALDAAASGPGVLARAAFDGRPGHPVVLGRDHWDGVLATATGDQGARAYLAAHDVALVECGDLATGHDVDARP